MAGEDNTNQQRSNVNINYNAAQTGIDMDKSLGQITKGKLTYALNANVENFDSNSVNYQNEEGNEFCLNFPSGYILIGKHYIQEKSKHIFFLVNPITKVSQIGCMINNDCTYRFLFSADCLKFDINYPIHKIVHRITNCSTEIYWTDGLNSRRFLDIDNIPTSGDLCNKLSVQPNFSIPQLTVDEITAGGELTAGTYQFAIQYCDAQGFGYTSYYSVTNPTPIANPAIISAEFNYPVNKSIKLSISNLEVDGYYEYYNLAVIKTVNSITSVELIGTYYINSTVDPVTGELIAIAQVTYTGQNQTQIRLSINDIFEKFPYYDIAQDVTSVQDVLVWDQLTTNKRVNYQKIFAKVTLQWQSYQIPVGINYSNSNVANRLRGYLRDEVYAIEGCFLLKNGKQTDGFHIPGRKIISEIDEVPVLATSPDFIGKTEPDKNYAHAWRIYNTAYVNSNGTGGVIAGAIPYKYGEFSYWESEEKYTGEIFAAAGLTGGIRHHKFPDVLVSPVFESNILVNNLPVSQASDNVYTLGIRVDISQIKTLIAESDLSSEEKAEIVGFKLLRGSRSTNKSIVGKGILRNVGKYTREGTDYYFPNYPYNDLNPDPFLLSQTNAYNSQSKLYSVYNVTKAGSLSYTNCFTNQIEVKQLTIGMAEINFCSITYPVLSKAIAFISQQDTTTYAVTTDSFTVFIILLYSGIQDTFTSIGVNSSENIRYISVPRFASLEYQSGSTNYTIALVDNVNAGILNEDLPNELRAYPSNLNAFSTDASKFRMVFNSPETSFGQPTLGSVLKLESALFGESKSHFVQVKNNAKYKFINATAQKQALQSSYNIAISTGTLDGTAMFTTYQAYLQIYINGINRTNFAYSFNSIASFDYWKNIPNSGNKQRKLDIYQYLIPGVQSVSDNLDVNNFQRESSVYLKTSGTSPLPFVKDVPGISELNITDKTRFTASQKLNCGSPENVVSSSSVMYYASLKNILPNQYGQLYSYETIDTGFQVDLDTTDRIGIAFGGDTFISRFAFKTKLPFFIDNRVNAPDDSDVFYDEIGNIAYPRYWHSSRSVLSNYQVGTLTNLQNIISVKATSLDCPNDVAYGTTTSTVTTQAPGTVSTGNPNYGYLGKMYMFAYGIPSFYCESSINLDLRQATNSLDGDFYPRVSSGIPDNWLQQNNVPIALDNTYNYNITFSKQNTENYFSHLPTDWDGSNCRTEYPFRAIYSDPQVSDPISKVNNWLIYRPVSYFDFPQNYGDLISLDGIQNKGILARFENKSLMYNTMLTINTSNPQAAYVGNSTLFRSAPPVDFAETDLGYVGSQHKMLLKIPEGQITIDAKRGQIFLLSGEGASDITGFGSGVNRFMTDHLAFEILRYFPNVDVDNNFKGIGLSGVYDSKYNRVIITKLDYIPQPNYVGVITYNNTNKEFYVENTIVSVTNPTYFCNKSWTMSFSMITKSWISFHSYTPNYYIGDNNFYYSGKAGIGMWRHLTNTLLNNNYYGSIAPYIIEYPFTYQFNDEILQNVKDYTRTYQYLPIIDGVYNDNAKIQTDDHYFNKAILYNGQQSTGLLNLVKRPKNNLSAYNQYPMYNADSKTILFTKSDSFYQYNNFWNVVKDRTKVLFNTTCESLSFDKVINQSNMDYTVRSYRKDPLRAKGLLIRHILDNRSDIHLVSQFIVNNSQISYK